MENNRPFEILSPYERWVPTREQLVQSDYEKLLPPLVHKIREAVSKWRDSGYAGASGTSKSLLHYWFDSLHKVNDNPFRFFFSQQEAIESIIYLYETARAQNKYELMKFDSSNRISTGMFDETWPRYVIKMATGSGKTKVMALALALAWSYFHKLYEDNSTLSKNILIIAPNIIVLNRLRKDFDNFRIFREEPFIPDNGYCDRDWKNDFQMTLHLPDDVKPITGTGNLFLTNIHRVYFQENDVVSFDEEFLGPKPKPDADTSRGLDLGKILRSGKLKDLVVVGTSAFIEFVEELKTEGVTFEYRPLGHPDKTRNPIIVEVDRENPKKDLDILDIEVPILSPRVYREYKNLESIDVEKMPIRPVPFKTFKENELKEIVFKDIDDKFSHATEFSDIMPDYRNVIAFFARNILKESRLVSGFDIIYPKVREFIEQKLFGKEIRLDNPQTTRNLSEMEAKKTIYSAFKKAIDELTVTDKGTAEIRNYIRLRNAKPMVESNQPYFIPRKSIFNKIIADNRYELEFASFLDNCPEVISFAKNHRGIYFKMEYQAEDGNIHEYFPDFFVKTANNIFIVETKGREDPDDLRKIERLKQWCRDINDLEPGKIYIPLYVKQEDFEKNRGSLKSFKDIQTIGKIT